MVWLLSFFFAKEFNFDDGEMVKQKETGRKEGDDYQRGQKEIELEV